MTGARSLALVLGLVLVTLAGEASAGPPELLAPLDRTVHRDGPVTLELELASETWPVLVEVDGELVGPRMRWPAPRVELEPGIHRVRVLDRSRTHASAAARVIVFAPKDERLDPNTTIAVVASVIALLGATLLRRRGL